MKSHLQPEGGSVARSTNNLSLSTTKIIVSDDELVDPPLKPRAIRRKASLFAERRRREQWLTILGGDSVIEQIEEHNTRLGRESEVACGRSFAEVFDESFAQRIIQNRLVIFRRPIAGDGIDHLALSVEKVAHRNHFGRQIFGIYALVTGHMDRTKLRIHFCDDLIILKSRRF